MYVIACEGAGWRKKRRGDWGEGREGNLNFLKKSRVQINFKLNEKSPMITY